MDFNDVRVLGDKKEWTAAQESPWYALLTSCGEHEGNGYKHVRYNEIHKKNRRIWHGFICDTLTESEKDTVVKEYGVDRDELQPLSDDELSRIKSHVRNRTGQDLPDPRGMIDLEKVRFDKVFSLEGFYIPQAVNFYNSEFERWVIFQDAVFHGQNAFVGAKFRSRFVAINTEFFVDNDFFSVFFYGDADFRRSCFIDNANFQKSEFFKSADFTLANFHDDLDMIKCHFWGEAKMNGIRVGGRASFIHAKFEDSADLQSSQLLGPVSFFGAKFLKSPPFLFEAELHENAIWPSKENWPRRPASQEQAAVNRAAFERLKLLMASQNKFRDEHLFLTKEFECREIESGASIETYFSMLYGLISKYGTSIKRPLWALAGTIFFGWLIMCATVSDEISACPPELGESGDLACLGNLLLLSFSNTFSFLGLSRNILSAEMLALEAYPIAEIVSVSQMVLGPIFLFFVLLALRNNFRMK